MGTATTCRAALRAGAFASTWLALTALSLAPLGPPTQAATEFSEGGVMIDPTFHGLPPPSRSSGPDLMPAPIEHPAARPGPVIPEFAPGMTLTPNMLETLDAAGSQARFRGDVGTRLRTGESLEDHALPDRLGATLTVPF